MRNNPAITAARSYLKQLSAWVGRPSLPLPNPPAELGEGHLVELSSSHQIAPLLDWHLGPSEERADLETRLPQWTESAHLERKHHGVANLVLLEAVEDIASRFALRGIEWLVFKGPWLAWRAYPDPSTRPMGDIDLCIHEHDYPSVMEILAEVGYQPIGPMPRDGAQALSSTYYREQLRFVAPGRPPVELHFRMVNFGRLRPTEEWLWNGAAESTFEGVRVRHPSDEAMFFHVCLHTNQHAHRTLRLLHDVRCTRQAIGPGFDSDAFLELVDHYRCRCAVYHSLLLATELAGMDPEQPLMDRLRPHQLRSRIYACAWDIDRIRSLEAPRQPSHLEAPLFYFLEVDRPLDKLVYAIAVTSMRARQVLRDSRHRVLRRQLPVDAR